MNIEVKEAQHWFSVRVNMISDTTGMTIAPKMLHTILICT